MALKDAGKALGLAAIDIFKRKAGDLYHSLTDQQKTDITDSLIASAELGVMSMAGDVDAGVRLAVEMDTLGDYKLKGEITTRKLAVEALKEAFEAGAKIVFAILVSKI